MGDKMTIKTAVRIIWQDLPEVYFGNELIRKVREIMHRPFLKDGSVDKLARVLRKEGTIDFDCIDRFKSIYRKKEGEIPFLVD